MDEDFDDIPLSTIGRSSSRKRALPTSPEGERYANGIIDASPGASSKRGSSGSPAKRSRLISRRSANDSASNADDGAATSAANRENRSSRLSRKVTKSRRKVKSETVADEGELIPERPTNLRNNAGGNSKSRTKEEQLLDAKNIGRSSVSNGAAANGTADSDANGDEKSKWWESNKDKSHIKWTTLLHHGVVFPPAYEPHGVPIKYDGEPVHLEPEAEEIATFYAAKLETDYVKKDTFNKNFFDDFKRSLARTNAAKIVKKLNLCDFSDIHALLEKRKAEKKAIPAAEKKKQKELEKQKMAKYAVALVDGREEKIGNFRVEPPGLFLGRGEHPKMGRVKKRILPEDITINIGMEAPVPECLPGHSWQSVVHKQDVTWLAGWKDTITNGHKYVWLGAGSTFKGMSDHAKFEKARKLKDFITNIRKDYREGWGSKSKEVRQRAVAMYLIDKLALRVGNEKGEDEADTVGCCSLRVEHIKFLDDNMIEFDFLGKDSIRYYNEVEVEPQVYRNMKLFCETKGPKDSIFHRLTVTGLNDYLKGIMPGLSAKVFRTYNASITLSSLLDDTPENVDLNDLLVFYNQQNKEVAILCNHQRALPKAHASQMEKLQKKREDLEKWVAELQRARKELRKKNSPDTVEITQMVPVKPELTPEMTDEQRAKERKRVAELPKLAKKMTRNIEQVERLLKTARERLAKLNADMTVKEELKTVALGTSKINYLDPRITVAWCKKHNVPIERLFPKTLLEKFAWAMETSQEFKF